MEGKVEIIQETLEINEKAAKKALQLAEGDLDKALLMGDYVDENYIIIHGKMSYGNYNKIYNSFSIIADGKKGEFIKIDSALGTDSNLLDINLKVNNQVFRKSLNEIQGDKKKIPKSQRLKPNINKEFNPADIFKLLDLLKGNKQSEFILFFKEKIENIVQEEIDLELYSIISTKAQLKNCCSNLFSDKVENKEEENNEEEKEKLGLDINLNCNPVISATKGKKVSQLQLKDKILVKITDKREIGKYLNDLLKNEQGVTTGEIQKLNFNQETERYSVLIKFGPNIYGSVIVGSKIKVAIPETKKIKVQDSQDINIEENIIMIFSLVALFVILLILIIAFFLY